MYRNHHLRMLVSAVALVLLAGGCAKPKYTGQDAQLAARLDAVLTRLEPTGATLSARVVDVAGGRELYARDPDVPCVPASNMKLPIGAAGLDRFGLDHTFKTWLALDGDDLWIIGTGDPGTGDPRIARAKGGTPVSMFDNWAEALTARGIHHIGGTLYYDDSAFEPELVHPTWDAHLLHWYAAPISGLNFNDNCVDITVYPTSPGQPVRFDVMPPVKNIQIINRCVTGDKNDPAIAKRPEGDVYEISGTCSQKTELKSKPVGNPGAFFADAFRTHLATKGITLSGEIRRAPGRLGERDEPDPAKVIAVHETRMSDILVRINKNSQNMFAECMLKLVGRYHAATPWEAMKGQYPPGSWRDGAEAVRAFLHRSGIDTRGLAVVDGSGLSVDNRITARQLSDLLLVMARGRDGKAFRESLAEAGVDGSLGQRLTEFRGRVYAKTGFIGGVRTLSGYVKTDAGRWLAFSILHNDIPDKVEPFEELQDEAVRILVHGPQPVP